MALILERDGRNAEAKGGIGTFVIAHQRAAQGCRLGEENGVGREAVGAAQPGRTVDIVNIVAVEVLVVGHGRVPDTVVEEQGSPSAAEDVVLDGRDVQLRAFVGGQEDGAAVAARDHHHVAHELARLVGEAIGGAELEQGRGVADIAKFVDAGAVLMPADAFGVGVGGLPGTPRGLQNELVAVEGADFGEDGGVVDKVGEVGFGREGGARFATRRR